MRGLFARLRPLFRRSQVEQEMDQELRFHIQQLADDFQKSGLSPEEALRRARLEFGGLGQVKDDARDIRFADRLHRLWRGLRIATRSLIKSPVFTLVGVLTLALGIGVNTLMYSMLDQLVLRNLPVRNPDRLVAFHGNFVTPGMYRGTGRLVSFSWPKYRLFRDHCDVFSGVAARYVAPGSMEYNGAAEQITAELVSGNYFDVLGIRPAVGRLFTAADAQHYMAHPIVVLGYSFWQRRFSGDPGIVGRQIHVNGMAMTVVGVSAPGFHSIDRGNDEELRVPIMMKDLFTPGWKGFGKQSWAWLQIVGRIKPGLSPKQAEAGANVFYHQVLSDEVKLLPASYAHRDELLKDHLDLMPAAAGMVDQMGTQRAFFIELLGISAVVLLIACVNLAGLLLARTNGRQRELAIRLALGAGRWGVARQLLGECLLLTAVGGGLGILLAACLLGPVSRLLMHDSSGLIDPHLDWRVLLFALGVTAFTSLIFSVVPPLQLRHLEVAGMLKNESGASSSRSQVRLRKVMVAAQLAFCVWLMIAAGLFARSLSRLRSVDLGFRKEHLVTFVLDPMISGYQMEQAASAFQRVTGALAALPGVTAVGSSSYGILGGNVDVESIVVEGYTPPPPDVATGVRTLIVSPGYFPALGVTLLAGRNFTPADVQPNTSSVIVNQAFARHFFGGQSPVGRHIGWFNPKDQKLNVEVVGMVRDQRYDGPAGTTYPFYYVPGDQAGQRSFYVRTSLPPERILPSVQRAVAQQAPGAPLNRLRTMEQYFDESIDDRTSIARLAGFFGLLATLLAAIGLYGVMAYTVARRTREIGIRMALGANRGSVVRMVLREVGRVVGLGICVGLPSGLAMARLIRSELFSVSPLDISVATVAVCVVAAIALAAGLLPARRATTIDPMRALRWE